MGSLRPEERRALLGCVCGDGGGIQRLQLRVIMGANLAVEGDPRKDVKRKGACRDLARSPWRGGAG